MQQGIVEDDIDELQGSITEKLHSSLEMRFLEHNEFRQEEPDRKAEEERHYVSGNIPGHLNTHHCDHLALQQVIIGQEIDQQTQYRNPTATGYIPEGLDRDPFAAYRMEKIDHIQDRISHKMKGTAFFIVFHRWAKVIKMAYFWTETT